MKEIEKEVVEPKTTVNLQIRSVTDVLNYLMTRPYQETAVLITDLLSEMRDEGIGIQMK